VFVYLFTKWQSTSFDEPLVAYTWTWKGQQKLAPHCASSLFTFCKERELLGNKGASLFIHHSTTNIFHRESLSGSLFLYFTFILFAQCSFTNYCKRSAYWPLRCYKEMKTRDVSSCAVSYILFVRFLHNGVQTVFKFTYILLCYLYLFS
jgi:hypothetical protein